MQPHRLVHHWIQQNHDGLPQKAGFPQGELNEIHGSWYDPSNPVVKMSGYLRSDLIEWLEVEQERADLVLCLGTSLSGMRADSVATTAAQRATGLGTVIIALQQTPFDSLAALRIYARIDTVMRLLAERLGLDLSCIDSPSKPLPLPASDGESEDSDVFYLPYKKDGRLASLGHPPLVLHLGEGAKVLITAGPHAGDIGEVTGKDSMGNYRITFRHTINKKTGFCAPFPRALGAWFITAARNRELQLLPVVPAPEAEEV